MDLVTEELVKAELAERRREAERFTLASAARLPRLPLGVRLGLRLVALGERLGGARRAAPGAPTVSRVTDR